MDDRNGEKRLIEGVMDRTRPGWRARQARRKSPWNLVGILVAFVIMGFAGYGLWLAAWQIHLSLLSGARCSRPGILAGGHFGYGHLFRVF